MVAFPRELKRGDVGMDVVAVKRAMSKAGYIRWGGFTPVFGPFFERTVKKFQADHKLTVTGRYDKRTHAVLADKRDKKGWPVFDAYGRSLMEKAYAKWTKPDPRKVIVDAANFYYDNRDRIRYSQVRPVKYGKVPYVPSLLDCSGGVQLLYYQASDLGVEDPSGYGYAGWGNTYSQIRRGREVPANKAVAGDLVFYGPWKSNPTHVAMCMGDGRVWSMGSDKDPAIHASMDYRRDRIAVRRYLD